MRFRGRGRVVLVLAAACVLFGGIVGDALATGELTQKPPTAGCISETGSGGACVNGTALNGAWSVTVSADGKSAYAASSFSDAVVVFDRNTTTGALTQKPGTAGCISENGSGGACVDGTALDGARSVTVSADDKNAYGASSDSDAVVVFDRNTTTGALTQKPGTAGCISETGSGGACVDGTALDGAQSVTVSADGKNAYAASSDSGAVVVFDRDTTTGALTQKPGTAGCISDDGSGGSCVDGTALVGAQSVTVSTDGKSVYAASLGSDAVVVFDRNTATGALTQKPGTAGCISETGNGGACVNGTALSFAASVAVSADGKSVYAAAGFGSDAVAVFDRNTATGALTQKPGTAGCISETGSGGACVDGTALSSVRSVTVSADGKSVYAASLGSDAVVVFDRDTTTGALTQKPATAGCISNDGSGGACVDGTELDTPRSVAVSADGKSVYAALQTSDAVVVFDRAVVAVSWPAVVRTSTTWLLRDSLDTGLETTPSFIYGARPNVPLMGDWDGNGSRTPGSYEGGVFKLNNANDTSAADITFTFGDRRGFPVAGDFDADGTEDVAVYRAGTWEVRLSAGNTFLFPFGSGSWPATVPVAGDWDGDGIDGIGTFTRSTTTWNLRHTATALAADAGSFVFGSGLSYPVVGDWNGDRADTVAVKDGVTWRLRNTNTAGAAERTFDYGMANELPLSWRRP